jgi:hypothetical protein
MDVSANELQVKNLTISQQPQFAQGGKVVDTKIVTFYIGDHGPFRKQYPAAEYTVERVRQDIASEVQGVRALLAGV